MAGYKSSEPRDKKGRWTEGDGGWPRLDPQLTSRIPRRDTEPPIRGDLPYKGRTPANFKIAKEDRGKPRSLYQKDKIALNPSTPTQLTREAKTMLKHGITSAEKSAIRAQQQLERELYGKSTTKLPTAYRSQSGDLFSNVPIKEQSRLNRNLGQAPTGLRKPPTQTVAKRIVAQEGAHQKRLMATQRNARTTRDAGIDRVLSNPAGYHVYSIGNGPKMITDHPLASRVAGGLGRIEKGLAATEKFLNKWWK